MRLNIEREDPVVLDAAMRRMFAVLDQIAPTPLPILLLGETGSGKEVAAEWVHRQSGRPPDRFLRLNCSALSESVVESELFGHERGAFTGAVAARPGIFEAAHEGTLFLDEIAELSPRIQAKLLRVLESGEIIRVGSTQARRVDVRLIAATHRDLPSLIQSGHFREDLYFRLNGMTLHIPRLRDRPSEILPIAMLFVRKAALRLKRDQPALGEKAVTVLMQHPWPGNIRELRNVIERAVATCSGNTLQPENLMLGPTAPHIPKQVVVVRNDPPPSSRGVRSELRAFERNRILEALARTGGNQTRAAALLRVSRRTLTNKLNAYAIDRPRKRICDAPAPAEREETPCPPAPPSTR
jgi:transcriptional regulator with PAS, ATPase and Fis domain